MAPSRLTPSAQRATRVAESGYTRRPGGIETPGSGAGDVQMRDAG